MQVSGTFPELSSGLKKKMSKKRAEAPEPSNSTMMKGRFPRKTVAPSTLGGRRDVAHIKGKVARRGR